MTYGTAGYYAPDNVQWDQISGIVAELEGKLMAGCDDLIEQIELLVAALSGQSEQVALIADEMPGIKDALACLCSKSSTGADSAALGPIVDEYLGDETLQVDDPYPGNATPGIPSDACAIAQLTYAFMFETLTEIVQPAQKQAIAVLLPAAMAVIASWIGTPLLGIPVGVLLAVLWDVVEIWVDGRLQDVVNSLYSLKDEIVCALYTPLSEAGSLGAASQEAYAVIADQEDLSPIDKAVLKGLCAPWVLDRMALAWTNQTAWATSRVSVGYCEDCPEDPIIGSDWVAVKYIGPNKIITLEHPAGSYWAEACWNYTIPDGFTLAGMFFETYDFTGNCQEKRMEATVTCGAPSLTGNTSDDLIEDWYFMYDTYEFNDTECLATIRPTARVKNDMFKQSSGPCAMLFHEGWNCTGSAKIKVHYLVFKGTTPPS